MIQFVSVVPQVYNTAKKNLADLDNPHIQNISEN